MAGFLLGQWLGLREQLMNKKADVDKSTVGAVKPFI